MDFGDAFHTLTKGMEEFNTTHSKHRKAKQLRVGKDEVEKLHIKEDHRREFLRNPNRPCSTKYPRVRSFLQLTSTPYSFPPETMDVISSLQYTNPMPVQTEAIPVFYQGHHMLVGAPTGSGKTAAYLLPLLNFASSVAQPDRIPEEKHLIRPHSIILSTTQELLGQIWTDAVRLGQNSFPLSGKIAILRRKHYKIQKTEPDTNVKKKSRVLRLPKDTRILITTPKRLATLMNKTRGEKCPIGFESLKWLVIDECDKMLEANIGGYERDKAMRAFRTQLSVVFCGIRDAGGGVAQFPSVALFSATMPAHVIDWATEELFGECSETRGLLKLQIGSCDTAVPTVKQELRYCGTEEGKLLEMRSLLVAGLAYPCLIFTESRQRAGELHREILISSSFTDKTITASVLSGETSETQRAAIVKAFREGEVNVLICTDLLGRGMDFRSLMMVVNYDLPPSPVEFIHRVGRAGRAGRPGRAITLWTDADLPHLDAILEVMRKSAPETVDPDLQMLVQAWKARKARQLHARATGGVLSRRKGERKLAAKVVDLEKKKNRQRHLLRPWNPHRGSITDVVGSKQRDVKLSQGSGVVKKMQNKKKKAKKKTTLTKNTKKISIKRTTA